MIPAPRPGPADLPAGRRAMVTTPASSANLGPGFDAFGLALDWADTATATVLRGPSRAVIMGESAERMPTDGRHLVIRTVLRGLGTLGARVPGIELHATNTIPHGRGLGSSSAAIVSGLALAWGLARPDTDPDLDWLVTLATEIEGHPDNVAAAAFGGFVIATTEGDRLVVTALAAHPELAATVYVPDHAVSTHATRKLLPMVVPHQDAAANAGRAALAALALTQDPDLLVLGTRDWLHTDYRREAMPSSYDLLTRLRGSGAAAVISGAGPTVLVLGRVADLDGLPEADGFVRRRMQIGPGVRVHPTGPDDAP